MTKNIVIGVLAVTTLLFGYLYFKPLSFGAANPTGPIHYQMEGFTQGAAFGGRNQSYFDNNGKFTLGSSGTTATQAQFGTCNLGNDGVSFAATTTKQFYCTVTGVAASDLVLADLPVGAGANGSGAGSLWGGFLVVSAYATTSNQIGVTVLNMTGAATSSYPQATTTVEYRVLR